MLASPDFKDLLSLFEKFKVRFLVVGGYAVMKYTGPRSTGDLDVLISTDQSNARAVFDALRVFGAPLKGMSPADFTQKGYFYQMGRAPFRIDVMMSIPGIEFEDAWKKRVEVELGGSRIPFISKEDLIISKRASGRPRDLLDAEDLEKAPA